MEPRGLTKCPKCGAEVALVPIGLRWVIDIHSPPGSEQFCAKSYLNA